MSTLADFNTSITAALPRIGTWQTVELISVGNWCNVYRARPSDCDPEWHADYALKISRPNVENAAALVLREVSVGLMANHPHVVSVLTSGIHEDCPYFVSPFLKGVTLAKAISSRKRPPLHHAVWLARQVAEGLSEIHGQGFLHSDVAPQNVIVGADGHATLIDLGCARKLGSPECAADSPIVGNFQYCAPEQICGHLARDHRCDLYSLGIVLFELITGELPFSASTPAEWLDCHLHARPAEIRSLVAQIPRSLSHLISQLLAKDPLRRPTTTDLLRQLVRIEVDTLMVPTGGWGDREIRRPEAGRRESRSTG